MAEETKKKKNTTKTTSTKSKKKAKTKKVTESVKESKTKEVKKSTSTKKKESAKKTTKPVEKKVEKKVEKAPVKKETPPKVKPKVEEKVEPKKAETKEALLEKTLIFDGRQNKNLAEVVEKLEEQNVVLEDKIIKRSKGKKIAIIALSILIAIIILLTTIFVVFTETERKINAQTLNSDVYKKVSRKYKTISDIKGKTQAEKDKEDKKDDKVENAKDEIQKVEYSNIEEISLADFERKVFEKENMTILIASKSCYHCITFEPVVNEVCKDLDKNIYKIDIMELTDEENDIFRTYYAYKSAPTLFTIKDGVVKSDVTGTMTNENLKKWLNENA